MMKFSRRSEWTSQPNELTKTALELKAKGIEILDFTESNPTRCHFQYFHPDLLKPLLDPKNLIYDPDPHGLFQTREAVSRYYAAQGIKVTPEQIFLTASTSEAYSFAFRLLVNAGESIAAPQPSYPLLDYLAGLNDIEVVRYPLRPHDAAWRISPKELEGRLQNNTRAILAVHPNNPTGNYLTPAEQTLFHRVAKSR